LFAGLETFAQQGPPVSPKPINSQFYITLPDSAIYQNMGSPYGWGRFAKYKDLTVSGFTVTSLPAIGQAVSAGSVSDVLRQLFAQSQPPSATLSGGSVAELTSASTVTFNLNWSGSRQSATANLSSIVIAGNSQTLPQTFANPSAPGTVSGTQSVTAPTNVSTVYTNTVTTADGKTATATSTQSYLPRRYWGRSAGANPDNTIILASAGGSSELSSSRAKSGFTVSSSGSNYVYYAYPSSEGALTSLTIGGFESLPAFTQNTISITNASGYMQNYFVYVSNNTFSANTPSIITQ
jgi:hypothetical protein